MLKAGACDHDRVGFAAIWNWGELGDGHHTAVEEAVKNAVRTYLEQTN